MKENSCLSCLFYPSESITEWSVTIEVLFSRENGKEVVVSCLRQLPSSNKIPFKHRVAGSKYFIHKRDVVANARNKHGGVL